ncbi:hypothetical protein PVAP13_9KG295900, partial [Panicum virgatum]
AGAELPLELTTTVHGRRSISGSVLLALGLFALAVLAHHALFDADGRLVVLTSWWPGGNPSDDGSGATSPWAVAAVVALLLVLASHKPSFQWLRPPFYHK